MFRRIEVIACAGRWDLPRREYGLPVRWGAQILNAMSDLPLPSHRHGRRTHAGGRVLRYFFTEAGWRRFRHQQLAAARAAEVRARVITTKERNSRVRVYYRDRWQVLIGFGTHPTRFFDRRQPQVALESD